MHKIDEFITKLSFGFSIPGLLLAALFFAFSLTPSLVPRPFILQGLISGLSFTAGYALGVFGRWFWAYIELPLPSRKVVRFFKIVAVAVCTVVAIAFLWQASKWQNSLRMLMGMEAEGAMPPFGIGLMTMLVFAVLIGLARLFQRTFIFLSQRLARYLSAHVASALSVVAVAMLFWSVINGVIVSLALRAADNSYQQLDALIQDDLERPENPLKTGSAASLIAWSDLGRQGHKFISSGPTGKALSDFFSEPTLEPIRIYVGLNAADTPEERAELALKELKRVDAFKRSVLLLVTPTGTGWVDPAALDTAEYLHRGDIATVTAQYSYLPSALSLITEGEYGAEMARALFEKVYRYWTKLPHDERPKLYLHGLSLGALNSDRSFDIYDIIQDPFNGALWSGPPFRSETWRKVTREREPNSPVWLPRFRDGAVVRFMNQYVGLNDDNTPWGPFRIAYLQYASDPITFFDSRAIFREPEWMLPPRGPDVSPHLRWYPIVTMLQLAMDMMVGSTPPGFGHTFAATHYIDAWLALTEPKGWTEENLKRLRALFAD
jgi:uncharacterized membrane protein